MTHLLFSWLYFGKKWIVNLKSTCFRQTLTYQKTALPRNCFSVITRFQQNFEKHMSEFSAAEREYWKLNPENFKNLERKLTYFVSNCFNNFFNWKKYFLKHLTVSVLNQPTFTCSESTKEIPEQCAKSVQN